MGHSTSNKKVHVILTILSIILVVLTTAFFLQGRQLNKLKEKAKENSLAEKSQTEVEAGGNSLGKSLPQDDEEKYKKKIKKLETQITALQEQQDDLEKTLNEYDDKDDAAASNRTERNTVSQVSYAGNFKGFLEENNYPPGTTKKLDALYIEKNNAMNEFFNSLKNANSGKRKPDPEAAEKLMRRPQEIEAEFDKKRAELLSEEGLAALKEYEKTSSERFFVDDLQRMLGDNKLEKEKAKELIAVMYEKSLAIQEEQRINAPHYYFNGKQPDKETMARIRRESHERGLENTKKIYEGYLSCAEGFLSESQMNIFEGLINSRTITLMTSNVYIEPSETEKDE